jgi:hypothetical protein
MEILGKLLMALGGIAFLIAAVITYKMNGGCW